MHTSPWIPLDDEPNSSGLVVPGPSLRVGEVFPALDCLDPIGGESSWLCSGLVGSRHRGGEDTPFSIWLNRFAAHEEMCPKRGDLGLTS
jgi:hypothetical protein